MKNCCPVELRVLYTTDVDMGRRYHGLLEGEEMRQHLICVVQFYLKLLQWTALVGFSIAYRNRRAHIPLLP